MITQWTLIFTFFLVGLVFTVPSRFILLPYIVAACFVPADQRVIIFDLDFTILRILIVAGVLRIVLRGEKTVFNLNSFDKLVFAWAVCSAIIYVLRWASVGAIIYKCGILFDVFGMYWLFRRSINTWEDIKRIGKVFAVCSLIMAFFVALERTSGRNPFIILGRVTTWVREERYRCQASFPHSIMLGLFWANLIPIFVGLLKAGNPKGLYIAAVFASVFMIVAAASSTPVLTLIAVIFILFLFKYRCYGRAASWGLLGVLLALHLVMQAPVWHLISRVDVFGGSTGWHRYHLINEAVNHFTEWAVIGTRDTSHWGFMLEDATNQYVLEGVRGGVITLALFVVILIKAVKTVGGYSLRRIPTGHQWLLWGICVSILGHCVSFLGVSYFGQIMLLLYLTFAIVGWIYGQCTSFCPTVAALIDHSVAIGPKHV